MDVTKSDDVFTDYLRRANGNLLIAEEGLSVYTWKRYALRVYMEISKKSSCQQAYEEGKKTVEDLLG